jgi:hypothetical protein
MSGSKLLIIKLKLYLFDKILNYYLTEILFFFNLLIIFEN